MKTQTRTDIHSPSNINPADYLYVGSFDLEAPMIGAEKDEFTDLMRVHAVTESAPYAGNPAQCDHCGAHVKFTAVWEHTPSGGIITTGETCASHTMNVPDRMTLDIKRLRDRASARRDRERMAEETRKNIEETRKFEPEAVEILENYEGNNSFLQDVRDRFLKWGTLTERQASAVVTSYHRENKNNEERENEESAPVVEGKITVTGEVKTVYFKENAYGSRLVMIVKDDRGFKVWGSVPSSIQDVPLKGSPELTRLLDQGDRVSFTATVTKSDRDETFGFMKRPTKAKVL